MPRPILLPSHPALTFAVPLAWAFVATLWFAPDEIAVRREADLRGLADRVLSVQIPIASSEVIEGGELVDAKRVVSGVIESSFAATAESIGLSAAVVDQFVDLLGERIEFRRDIRRGALFSVIFNQEQLPDGTFKSGPILAASLRNNGVTLAAIRYDNGKGKIAYYDENGEPIGRQFLRYPLKFSRISSVFSQARFHPLYGTPRPHNGVDFAAPVGTAVRAVSDGVVVIAGERGDAGRMLRISHGERYSSAYLHLSTIAAGLRPGSRVKRGQVIGAVGMSGAATGPHLHFALYDRDTYLNPLKTKLNFVSPAGDKLPAAVLASALRQLESSNIQMARNTARSQAS
ncbi:MAG: peptidoglycan DD-metalloendopeptidase family protein [Deltaproteobacteria bacterium]|nr:peptidoglycan DD-metalloendopeptidase family protein [Deltaproteobacteria bacterium]